MAGPLWIDQTALRVKLGKFFNQEKVSLAQFGSTVNQTFEAFVFAAVVAWYKKQGWRVSMIHPKKDDESRDKTLRLKFSTRGRPGRYSYALCKKHERRVQVRHQLRVSTYFHKPENEDPANVCLDVAVIRAKDLTGYSTSTAVPNDLLMTFGEAKHMAAFAELVASFVGLVHEMQPHRLRLRRKNKQNSQSDHVWPFLYVSGHLNPTARGIVETIENREYEIGVYHETKALSNALDLPKMKPPTTKIRGKRLTATAKSSSEVIDVPF